MNISDSVKYVGVNDHNIDLFEGQYIVENGMAYNSYVILDDKIAVTDTVDAEFCDEWLNNIKKTLDGKNPDYLIVHHMEPDHSANIEAFMNEYPNAVIVSSAKAFVMMKQFFKKDYPDRRVVVSESDKLKLGKHELTFIAAPMVHWPEVIVSYDSYDKILFSADGFGKFGALDTDEDWACEARRYYFGIVGKYGAQVQALLKKASALDIKTICPLHGPVLNDNLAYYLGLYNTWSLYEAEVDGVFIAYCSVYGNTEKAALELADVLKNKGCKKVVASDLARSDMAENVEDAFKYSKLVLATPTYNADVFPFMRTFINALTERGYKNRTIGIIENGSWAPVAGKVIKTMFDKSKDITFVNPVVTVKSALDDESSARIKELANSLL